MTVRETVERDALVTLAALDACAIPTDTPDTATVEIAIAITDFFIDIISYFLSPLWGGNSGNPRYRCAL